MKKLIIILTILLGFTRIAYAAPQDYIEHKYVLTISQAQNAKEAAPTACTLQIDNTSTLTLTPDCQIMTLGAQLIWVNYSTLNAAVTNSSTDWHLNIRGVGTSGDTINATGTEPSDTTYYEHDTNPTLGDNDYGGFALTSSPPFIKIRADEENTGALGAIVNVNLYYEKK
jgi:hypothetical protein